MVCAISLTHSHGLTSEYQDGFLTVNLKTELYYCVAIGKAIENAFIEPNLESNCKNTLLGSKATSWLSILIREILQWLEKNMSHPFDQIGRRKNRRYQCGDNTKIR
jgi:hypothetical protein